MNRKERSLLVGRTREAGFTLVELVVVILLIGILATVGLVRFAEVAADARRAILTSIAGSMRTTIALVRVEARLQGLTPLSTNPGAGQSAFLIESELGLAEVDFRNLCPESSAELGDALDMIDYLSANLPEDLTVQIDNRFTRIGYEITNSATLGCYLVYDSFGLPECTVDVVTNDC